MNKKLLGKGIIIRYNYVKLCGIVKRYYKASKEENCE